MTLAVHSSWRGDNMYGYNMYLYILTPAHNKRGGSVFRETNRLVTLKPTLAGGELGF